jgi:hypothetical protein
MASRKQRRRRQKERRHEYEFVYVDEQGHEVEVDPSEVVRSSPQSARRNGTKAASKGKNNRPVRKVDPPSWRRVAKRALIFAPLIFITFSLLSRGQPIGKQILLTLAYTAFFIPFMYLMDRAMYRTYLRRTGQTTPPRSAKR